MSMQYDKIIIGAGLYGMYAALYCAKQGQHVLVLEYEDAPFKRATYINQARVHMGYHYPRSFSTAIKSAGYFERFNEDYGFSVHREFEQIYATSAQFSWSSAEQFQKFCDAARIQCIELPARNYFKPGMCDGAFLTKEYTYDAMILRDYFIKELSCQQQVTIRYQARISRIDKLDDVYQVTLESGDVFQSGFVLNATYASSNQILELAGFDKLGIKYELCEIILCEVNDALKKVGFTVMDGPFFSIMPFGKTGLHSLTSVTFTPHTTSYEGVPTFTCQEKSEGYCSKEHLGDCNFCKARPETAYTYMSNLARKYLRDEYGFTYHSSLFSMKPILKTSEIDDSRPTVIRKCSENPTFISVLSGKINTVYDLDAYLN